jgi:hypothetical protein
MTNQTVTMETMVFNLNNQINGAIKEAVANSYIDDIFEYPVSNEVQVTNPTSNDVLIAITIYTPHADEQVKLVLIGTDENGVVDLISHADANEAGLNTLVALMNTIIENNFYGDAEVFAYFG